MATQVDEDVYFYESVDIVCGEKTTQINWVFISRYSGFLPALSVCLRVLPPLITPTLVTVLPHRPLPWMHEQRQKHLPRSQVSALRNIGTNMQEGIKPHVAALVSL